jgi:Bifunctional DNA primase/polymerase, N-terminal
VTTPDYNLEVATALAGAGYWVFPCDPSPEKPRGKKPLVASWPESSSSDLAIIRRLWATRPGAMVGLDLSKVGLLVLDFDRNHQDGVDGCANFDALLEETGKSFPFDQAPATLTPSGGYHVYTKQPVGRAPLGNSNRNLPPGIDVRGHGGYVIAPGSVRSDGTYYEMAPGFPDLIGSFVNGTIPEVPAWIVYGIEWREPAPERCPSSRAAPTDDNERDERLRRIRKILELATNDLVSMPRESGRNQALNNQAMRFAGWQSWCGITEGEVKESLLWACRYNGLIKEDGLPQCEATFRSGWNAGLLRPLRPPIERYPEAA